MDIKIRVRVLFTSSHKAHLVTDEKMVAWVMDKCLRDDNTLTPMGVRALLYSQKTLKDYEAEQEEIEAQKKSTDGLVSANFFENEFQEYNRSWKFRTNEIIEINGKKCHRWNYLPKSITRIVKHSGGIITVVLPKWLAIDKHLMYNEIERDE